MSNSLQRAVQSLDWEQLESDTRYLTHGIHRYSGKFIPQIAGQAIDLVTHPGELIVDPYTGSGTALLEAALRGRRSIGLDLNPLACLIARVKTTPVDPDALDRFVARLRSGALECTRKPDQPLPGLGLLALDASDAVTADPRWSDPWFAKWFPDDRRAELIAIDHLIAPEPDPTLRSVGLLALSDVLRRSSMANTSYPNVMYDRRKSHPPAVPPRFVRRLDEIASAVSDLQAKIPSELVPEVLDASACAMPLAGESADAVVTHPPYIGSIPYAEYGALSLRWLGHDPKHIDELLTGGRRQTRDVVRRFERDFDRMIAESARVLRSQRYLVMLLGSPTVKGTLIDLPAMALRLAESHGLRLDARVERRGGNRRANLMAEESLLFLKKA
jgi:hypothetical protein